MGVVGGVEVALAGCSGAVGEDGIVEAGAGVVCDDVKVVEAGLVALACLEGGLEVVLLRGVEAGGGEGSAGEGEGCERSDDELHGGYEVWSCLKIGVLCS